MLIVYFILLFMYIVLTLLYAFSPAKSTSISPWPLLPIAPDALKPATHCKVDSDCESNHVCLTDTCVPKLLRGGRCNPATGRWISFKIKNTSFAICSCLNEQLYSQKFFGGDCDVDVACGVHGQYNPVTSACDCNLGYRAVGLACQKLPALDQLNLTPCGDDEFETDHTDLAKEGFHADYIARLRHSKCVKRPCSFDALSGTPLKHAKYEADWGCVCDPRYGLFGVMLDGQNKKYLTSPGFDACSSIFVNEPRQPIDVQYMTYFYLGDRDPISIILFENRRFLDLKPLFRGKGNTFMITQSQWRFDFAQRFFKTHPTFRARTRRIDTYDHAYYFNLEVLQNHDYINQFTPHLCRDLYRIIENKAKLYKQLAYKLLYSSPVCKVLPDDPHSHTMFRDRVILNPHQVTYDDFDELPHFNAFVLKYDSKKFSRWTLDLDYEYKVEAYRKFRTNAPNWSDNPPRYI